ncbi:unnamed protein product [Orchesella dallaii]|uniref:LisH domain-containing protein n=1 Tax=Orchesella dallaii TaxID=48710 RepID=A0ABP1QY68_9HEXA
MEMSSGRNNSFQSVLDSIIRNYLLNELPPENDIVEKDFGLSRLGLGITLQNLPGTSSNRANNDDHNNNDDNVQYPGTSFGGAANGRNNDHEYIKALHKCFEKRGVFKELQTFLRHKLVSILQDEWPDLQNPVRSGDGPNTIVLRLVEDFLRCHKLLYTLSVLASESDVGQQNTRAQYGKLSSREAEDLLDEMGISRDTRLSNQILKCYFDKEHFSMLESLHYLGVWLDGPIVTNGLLEESNDMERHGKKKGTVTFISKAAKEAGEQSSKNYKVRNGAHDSLEQRLYELERSMEKDKEVKIKEAIEKFKKEEEMKIRQELEAKFKLDMMEKEREHLVVTQKKVEELTTGIERERQEWFEVKAKQENEILKLRKQVSDVMSAMITIKKAPSMPLESRSDMMFELERKKTESVPLVVHCSCDCKQKASTSAAPLNNIEECNTIYTRKKPTFSEESVQIQHDRMSFLQYRMEQQEEEIQALHRQLLFSASPATHPKPSQSSIQQLPTQSESHIEEDKNKVDDLSSFLKESKERMKKLEKVATEVDIKMQTILASTKRAGTPLSSELSARRASSAIWNRNVAQTTIHHPIHPSHLVTPALSFPPQINIPSPRYIEEIQPTYISSVRRNLPSFNFEMPSSRSLVSTFRAGRKSPPPSSQILPPVGGHQSQLVTMPEENRPSTPVNQIFPVAYGTQAQRQQFPTGSLVTGGLSARDSDIPPNVDAPKTVSASTIVVQAVEPEAAPEESLFHMAIREKPVASKSAGINLKQKAMLHGALGKEKVSSSDEGENSRNTSLSESFSKAITKSKVGRDEDDHFPMKVPRPRKSSSSEESKKVRRQSVIISGPSALVPKVKSNSSSSSSSKKSEGKGQQNHQNKYSSLSQSRNKRASPPKIEDDADADLSSLSISAPRSERDDDNEEFWKL